MMADFSRVPGLRGYQQQGVLNDQRAAQEVNTLGSLLNMKKNQMEMSVMEDNIARQKKIRDAIMAQQTGQVAPPAAGGQMGIPGQQQGAGGAGRALATKLNQTADIYERNGDFDGALKIREHAQKLMPELKDEQVRMGPEGKPVVIRNYKDGTTEVSPFAPADKLHFADTGGTAGVGMDPYTGKILAPGVQKTQTPDSLASNQITMRGQNMVDARARETLAQGKAPPGYRYTADGNQEFIPGGPADVKAQALAAQKASGASDVDLAVSTLRDAYDRLEKGGGITSTDKPGITNIIPSLSSSGAGQAVGKMLGTSNQSARNDIAMTRPALLAALMKATGMSAKQMDSNAELKLWLATATDPTLDVGSNRRALNNIEKKYLGGSAAPTTGGEKTAAGSAKPSMSEWMAKARTANPSASGAELEAYYYKKYGVK